MKVVGKYFNFKCVNYIYIINKKSLKSVQLFLACLFSKLISYLLNSLYMKAHLTDVEFKEVSGKLRVVQKF